MKRQTDRQSERKTEREIKDGGKTIKIALTKLSLVKHETWNLGFIDFALYKKWARTTL